MLELTSRELRVVAPRQLGSAVVVPRADVAAVVDLRVAGAGNTGLVGPAPLRRPPAVGALLAGSRTPPTISLVLRGPVRVSPTAARRLGLKARRGEPADLDAIELCPRDPDVALAALDAARYQRSPSVGAVLAARLGTVDDPGEAARVSAERERTARRAGLASFGVVLVPVVALLVAFALLPEARGQVGLLLGLWIGIGVVLGASLRRTNARTLARLGPPPDPSPDPSSDPQRREDR